MQASFQRLAGQNKASETCEAFIGKDTSRSELWAPKPSTLNTEPCTQWPLEKEAQCRPQHAVIRVIRTSKRGPLLLGILSSSPSISRYIPLHTLSPPVGHLLLLQKGVACFWNPHINQRSQELPLVFHECPDCSARRGCFRFRVEG